MWESRYLGTGTRSEHNIVASTWLILYFLKECIITVVNCGNIKYVHADKFGFMKIEYNTYKLYYI